MQTGPQGVPAYWWEVIWDDLRHKGIKVPLAFVLLSGQTDILELVENGGSSAGGGSAGETCRQACLLKGRPWPGWWWGLGQMLLAHPEGSAAKPLHKHSALQEVGTASASGSPGDLDTVVSIWDERIRTFKSSWPPWRPAASMGRGVVRVCHLGIDGKILGDLSSRREEVRAPGHKVKTHL